MAFGSTHLAVPTAAQRARHHLIKFEVGCICCRMRGYFTPAEVHHQLSGGLTISHDDTIGLCIWHHRGRLFGGESFETMRAKYGPSLAEGSKPFHEAFGSDAELLALQNKKLQLQREIAHA